jgi:hypothetical protein
MSAPSLLMHSVDVPMAGIGSNELSKTRSSFNHNQVRRMFFTLEQIHQLRRPNSLLLRA